MADLLELTRDPVCTVTDSSVRYTGINGVCISLSVTVYILVSIYLTSMA